LAFVADEFCPGFEHGEDGDDVAGVSLDGSSVEEGDDVKADGCGWVDPFAFDLVAVVDGGAGFVEVGEEGVGDDDVVDGFSEPAGVAGADEGAVDGALGSRWGSRQLVSTVLLERGRAGGVGLAGG
jgi:hypothetical protein